MGGCAVRELLSGLTIEELNGICLDFSLYDGLTKFGWTVQMVC